mgnify:CR=1 FL=1
MRRKLYLVNEVGSAFYFDYAHNCVIEEMDGFGFEFDIDYEEFDSRFVETKRKIPQRTLDLTLDFFDGYHGFTRWREYITKSKEIRLFYETSVGKKYCYVNVVSSSMVFESTSSYPKKSSQKPRRSTRPTKAAFTKCAGRTTPMCLRSSKWNLSQTFSTAAADRLRC